MSLTPLDETNPLVKEMSGIRITKLSISDNEPKLPDKGDEDYPLQRMFRDMDLKSMDNMHKFSREGDADRLMALIKHNPSKSKKYINKLNTEKMAPLHIAARYNHLDCVKILVENGKADANIMNEEKVTPLHFAARYRRKSHKPNDPDSHVINIEIMSKKQSEAARKRMIEEESKPTKNNSVILYLVVNGGNPNAQDCYGCTPLHYAAMRGNEVAAQQFLTITEVDTEVEDNESMTPLHLACAHNHEQIALLLLRRQANLFNKEESGLIPFHIVCTEGNFTLAKLLINMAEEKRCLGRMLSHVDNELNSPLHYAVENGHIEIVKILLEKGADPNAITHVGETPLHSASHCGSVELVKVLTSAGAKLDVINNSDQTPLHEAAKKNHCAVIEYLIEQGADTESRDADSYTPLLMAASYGHTEAISLLVNSSCDIFASEKGNKTALYLAVEENYPEVVRTILKSEENHDLMNVPDMKSNYPLHIAARNGRVEIVKLLLDYRTDDDVKNEEEQTPMHLAAKYGRIETIKVLLESSKDSLISDEDEDSNTPLHLAAESGFAKVVQLLLDKGADIDARNCNKWTALDCAAAKGKYKAAHVLLENDSPVDPMDKSKVTPLYLACKNGHDKLVKLLLSNNADVTTRVGGDEADSGCNPLDAAIDQGHRDCALAILKTNLWEKALRNQTGSSYDKIDTPMRKLIRKMPDIAEIVFNRCCKSNKKEKAKKSFCVTYNFEFLEDTYASWGMNKFYRKDSFQYNVVDNDAESEAASGVYGTFSETYDENGNLLPEAKMYTKNHRTITENHPLMIMVKSEREELLAHPLVTNLLRIKWNNFGQIVYYTNLSIFFIFLLSLLIYMSLAVPPYKYYLRNKTMGLTNSTCLSVQRYLPNESLNRVADVAKYFIIVFACFGAFKEIIQIIMQRLHYLNIENIIEWSLYILSFITVFDMSSCQRNIGIREPWQWRTGAVAAFIGVINLVLFIRKVPFFGIFVVMFTDVMWTFIKFLPLFLLFVFAFAFSFFVLLNNQIAFENLANSMLRTGVMMIGEFDFTDVFNSRFDDNPSDNILVFYDEVTYIIFVVFILMMSIITMNLLVGLAVDDIKMVQEKATLKRLAMKVTLALDVETLVPEIFRRRYIKQYFKDYPNKKANFCLRLFNIHRDANQMNNDSTDIDQLKRLELQQKATKDQVDNIKDKIKSIQSQNENLVAMVNQLLHHWKLNAEDGDEDMEMDNDLGGQDDNQ